MPLQICELGEHHYDKDIYKQCPHCHETSLVQEPGTAKGDTVKLKPNESPPLGKTPTVPLNQQGQQKSDSASKKNLTDQTNTRSKTRIIQPIAGNPSHDGATEPLLPVIGWLIITQGPGQGADFRLVQGKNRIGRSPTQEVTLNHGDDSISREDHATLLYDNHSNTSYVIQGESRNMARLNDNTIINATELKRGDIIQIGETHLMYVPLCNDEFQW